VTVLAVSGLTVRLGHGRNALTAVDGVDLELPAGGTLGLVGESGSGKSTVARALVGLVKPAAGSVMLDGRDFAGARGAALAELRRRVQLVFQDPRASLNPRMTIGEAIGEAIAKHHGAGRASREAEVGRLLEQVGLDRAHARSLPAQLSGGQRQRVALARALAVRPDVIVADEVTSALDASVQGSILNLLRELQADHGLSLLIISHDLTVVRYLSDAIAVMHLGRIVESASTLDLLAHPQHPYTSVLIDSVADDGRGDEPIDEDEPPDPMHPPSGCRFHTLCPVGPRADPERQICLSADPRESAHARAHRAACHFAVAREGVGDGGHGP
jgi:peptide/nickel transport system ATP-binding protein